MSLRDARCPLRNRPGQHSQLTINHLEALHADRTGTHDLSSGQSLYIPEDSSTDDDSDDGDESTIASSSDDLGPRPDWWPEDWPWPPEPEEPVVIEAPPPIHVWPQLPPDHSYHVPPGYEAPHNLPPGHPGEYYPNMPPYPVVHPGGIDAQAD